MMWPMDVRVSICAARAALTSSLSATIREPIALICAAISPAVSAPARAVEGPCAPTPLRSIAVSVGLENPQSTAELAGI